MKKILTGVLFAFLAACAQEPKQPDPPQTDKNQEYITKQNRMMVDLCEQENMPRYTRRPQFDRKKFQSFTDDDIKNGTMDAFLQDYMDKQNKYIDQLLYVITKTRQRVEQCR
ncbi:hypothetical protein [Burkholderia phage FLC8]|nr:hypothetical protein [Burkholderia phage FLC8]